MADPSVDPWGASSAPASQPQGQGWLQGGPADKADFDILDPFVDAMIPLDVWVEKGLDWMVNNFRPVFQAIRWPIDHTLTSIESGLTAMPDLLLISIMTLIAWQVSGKRLAVGTFLSLTCIGLIGAWNEAMVTLALVLTSVFFCAIIGLPAGIWLASSDRAATTMRPVLDAMQTTPAFVYLVPIVMLFGIGNVPGWWLPSSSLCLR